MTGNDLRYGRLAKRWTQEKTAQRLGVSQAYVALLEKGKRPVPRKLARRVQRTLDVPATALPLRFPETRAEGGGVEEWARSLGALGYPGFAYLKGRANLNPADLLLSALSQQDLDSRVAEALPWLVFHYSHMDWDWLVRNAKLHDLQNRLGFAVTLSRQLAEETHDAAKAAALAQCENLLERSRLAREDTFCHDSLTEAEKRWLRDRRPPAARHWNLLTDLAAEHLSYA